MSRRDTPYHPQWREQIDHPSALIVSPRCPAAAAAAAAVVAAGAAVAAAAAAAAVSLATEVEA